MTLIYCVQNVGVMYLNKRDLFQTDTSLIVRNVMKTCIQLKHIKKGKQMSKMKEFIVYVKQEYEPLVVMAHDRDDAIDRVQNHMTWGEPIDVEITAEEN